MLLAPVLPIPEAAAAQAPPPPLHTFAERTSWSELTPYEEVVDFYRTLALRSPDVQLHQIGTSRQGRELHLVTIARPAVADPREARASGKPIILIGAQAHGDEPAGKEGLMLVARDLAEGPLAHLLDDVIVILVPQLNPDGASIGSWGTRENRAGFNLNRDYLRLDNPETRAIVESVIVPWRPHVIVDAHELPGPPRLYDFYTLSADNINGPAAPERYTRERVIPAVVEAVEIEGFSHFVYHIPGNLEEDPKEGLAGGSFGARTLTSYGGAHGAISILYETLRAPDARIGLERRTRIHRIAAEALASFVAENAEEVVTVVEEGRRRMAERGSRFDPADSIAIRHDTVASRVVRYRISRSGGGSTGWSASHDVLELDVPLFDSAAVTLARVRPVGYVIEAHREDLARHLARHGIELERTLEPLDLEVERFEVDSMSISRSVYEGHVPQEVWTTPKRASVLLPAGSYLIRSAQPAAAILFHLLEPEGDNSYASVGAFASEASPGQSLPVYRLLTRPDLSNVLESFPERPVRLRFRARAPCVNLNATFQACTEPVFAPEPASRKDQI